MEMASMTYHLGPRNGPSLSIMVLRFLAYHFHFHFRPFLSICRIQAPVRAVFCQFAFQMNMWEFEPVLHSSNVPPNTFGSLQSLLSFWMWVSNNHTLFHRFLKDSLDKSLLGPFTFQQNRLYNLLFVLVGIAMISSIVISIVWIFVRIKPGFFTSDCWRFWKSGIWKQKPVSGERLQSEHSDSSVKLHSFPMDKWLLSFRSLWGQLFLSFCLNNRFQKHPPGSPFPLRIKQSLVNIED